MIILVSGGAGFIGSHLAERLLGFGHEVVVADSLALGRREHLSACNAHASFSFIQMDVTDSSALNALFAERRFDMVFHMAANSDIAKSHADPAIDFNNTLGSTWTILESMRTHQVKRLVFASSSAVYGEAIGSIDENHGPLCPISHYGATKLASEALISSYGENYGIQSWILRFPNVVGGRATHGAIYDFVRKLRSTPDRLEVLGDGKQIKPYLHVDDLIDAMLFVFKRVDGKVNIFNVGGTSRCHVRRIAEIVVEESGLDAVIGFTGGDRGWVGDVPSVEFDTSRIRALGWVPRLNSEDAVRAAVRAVLTDIPTKVCIP